MWRSNLKYDYNSYESENKLRVEHTTRENWRINYGAGIDFARYTNETFQIVYQDGPILSITIPRSTCFSGMPLARSARIFLMTA